MKQSDKKCFLLWRNASHKKACRYGKREKEIMG
jgi:hypothetical protein